jgi:hypothetical protein
VHDQVQAGGVDVDELAVPGDAVDEAAGQGAQRRVEGLQGAERRDVDPGDGPVLEPAAQVERETFDLGQLGPATSVGGPGLARFGPGRPGLARSGSG